MQKPDTGHLETNSVEEHGLYLHTESKYTISFPSKPMEFERNVNNEKKSQFKLCVNSEAYYIGVPVTSEAHYIGVPVNLEAYYIGVPVNSEAYYIGVPVNSEAYYIRVTVNSEACSFHLIYNLSTITAIPLQA